MHRHQLDRRHPERGQVLDDRRVGDAGVGAAHRLGHVRVGLGQALDVRLVDHRVRVLVARGPVDAPVEVRVDHHGLRHVDGRVLVVARVRVAEGVAEHRLVPVELAVDRLRVGVEQQLVRVAAMPLRRVPRAVHAVAVALTGLDPREEDVPDERVDLGQFDPGLVAGLVEETQLDLLGDLAEDREIGSVSVETGPERVGLTRPHAEGGRRGGWIRHTDSLKCQGGSQPKC